MLEFNTPTGIIQVTQGLEAPGTSLYKLWPRDSLQAMAMKQYLKIPFSYKHITKPEYKKIATIPLYSLIRSVKQELFPEKNVRKETWTLKNQLPNYE